MGSNFGDLDNDGYPDFYLGTGYPPYHSVMPNVMYRNRDGRSFSNVTYAGGFGHLQKGHGVVFADLDNDGDQDVFQQMGGAFPGDRFGNTLSTRTRASGITGSRSSSRGSVPTGRRSAPASGSSSTSAGATRAPSTAT